MYRGTSLIRNTPLLGPYSGIIPRVLWWSYGGWAVSYERGTPVPKVAAAGTDPSTFAREVVTPAHWTRYPKPEFAYI